MEIDSRRIGPDQPPYVVAELSANHNGRLETALRLIEEAQRSGADARASPSANSAASPGT